jgi:hypothetical protein
MKQVYKDTIASALAIAGAVVVFAKLESYSWWLIGSWNGALALLGAIGLGIMLTNITELVEAIGVGSFVETVFWLVAATVVIAGLLTTATHAVFVAAAVAIGAAWLAQMTVDAWHFRHPLQQHRYQPMH